MSKHTKLKSWYECDICLKTIDESDIYNKTSVLLWSDRDVSARAVVSIEVDIPYASGEKICCSQCAKQILYKIVKLGE